MSNTFTGPEKISCLRSHTFMFLCSYVLIFDTKLIARIILVPKLRHAIDNSHIRLTFDLTV